MALLLLGAGPDTRHVVLAFAPAAHTSSLRRADARVLGSVRDIVSATTLSSNHVHVGACSCWEVGGGSGGGRGLATFTRKSYYESAYRLRLAPSDDNDGWGGDEQAAANAATGGSDSGAVTAMAAEGHQAQAKEVDKAEKEKNEDEWTEGEDGVAENYVDEARVQLPDLVNPFKVAFEAGRKLRNTVASNLEQITGAASPVRG